MLRKLSHLLFNVLLVLLIFNYRVLTWKEYIFLCAVGVATGASYSRFGGILVEQGRMGLTVLHYILLAALFYLAAFPVAADPAFTTPGWWFGSTASWITVTIFALGLSGFAWSLAPRRETPDAPTGSAEDVGAFGEFMVAVLLTVIVIGGISIGVEFVLLPASAKGGRIDFSFLLVVVNGIILFISAARIFMDRADQHPPGLSGIFVVRDYRPQFLVLLTALSITGAYGIGRVLLVEWEAGGAYGAKDFVKAEKALQEVAKRNETLRITAIERRTLERLGEIYFARKAYDEALAAYRRMLENDPFDVLASIKLVQVDAARGNFKGASQRLLEAELHKKDEAALARLDLLLDAYPAYADGHFRVGMLYLQRGMQEKAAEKFTAVLAHHPQHTLALGELVLIMEQKGRAAEAAALRARMVVSIDEGSWVGRAGGRLNWYGECAVELDLAPGVWEVKFDSSGTPAKGIWPRLLVRIDDANAAEVSITTLEKTSYSAIVRVATPGTHKLSFFFVNDESVLDATGRIVEDRNARIYGATVRWTDK